MNSMHPLLEMISQPKSGEAEEPPLPATEQLRKLISDIDAFLSSYCDRFDRKLQQVARQGETQSNTPQNQGGIPDVDSAARELLEQKELWEAQKEQQELHIQEQLKLLQEAWLRLEEEQRSFLQTRESFVAVQGGTRTSTVPAAATGKEKIQPAPTRPATNVSQPLTATTKAAYSGSAIDEFQRLKQEIHNLRPQNPRS